MISVIVPVYNIEKYIAKCIESILNQTYEDFELLLIDDGSNDNSGEICDEYAKKDKRIRVFHKENGGVSSARNLGLKNIKGEYIVCIDGDDWIEKELFLDFVKEKEKKDVDVFMYEYYIDSKKMTVKHGVDKERYGEIDTEEALINNITPNNRFLWSKIFASRLIDGELFDENIILGEDTLFISSIIARASAIVYTDKAYYHYFLSENSAVRSNFKEKKLSGLDAYAKQIELCKETGFIKAADYAVGAYTELAIALAREAIDDKNFNEKETLKVIKKKIKNKVKDVLKTDLLSLKIKSKALVAAVSIRAVCLLCSLMGEKGYE